MNNYDLVGICGAAGCGKDTLAEMLSITEGYTIYRMADPIKRGLEKMFDLHRSVWDDRRNKEAVIEDINASPRELAQTLGTEWGRLCINPDLWVILADREFNEVKRMIVPDIRFNNEAEWIARKGGTLIHIVRPGQAFIPENDHASEAGIHRDLINHTIYNDSSKSDMCQKARKWLWDSSQNMASASLR
jgi:hypothetical protein